MLATAIPATATGIDRAHGSGNHPTPSMRFAKMNARPIGQCVRPATNEPSAAPAANAPNASPTAASLAPNARLKYGISATNPTDPIRLPHMLKSDVVRIVASLMRTRQPIATSLAISRGVGIRLVASGPNVRTEAIATCEHKYVTALITSAGNGPTIPLSAPPRGGGTRFTVCSVACSVATPAFAPSFPSRYGIVGVCAPRKIEPPTASSTTPA